MNKKLLLLNDKIITKFSDSFPTNYTPSALGVTYSNFYNNWNFYCSQYDYSGINSWITGGYLYTSSGTNGSGFGFAKMYRNLENYAFCRPISLAWSAFSSNACYGSASAEVSLFGNYSTVLARNNSGWSTPNFGGVAISMMGYNGNTPIVQLIVNGVGVQTVYISQNTLYCFFLDVVGNTISWSVNTTGVKPATSMYTYTASSITVVSNYVTLGVGGADSSYNENHAQIGAFSAILQ